MYCTKTKRRNPIEQGGEIHRGLPGIDEDATFRKGQAPGKASRA